MRSLLLIALLAVTLPATAEEAWVRHTIDDSSRGADGVRLADVDGDGDQDIATGWEEGGRVRVYLNPGPKKSKEKWPAVTVGNVKSPEDAVLVDLDGDGAMDVVSSCEGRTRTMFVHWAPRERDRYLDETAWTTEALPHSKDFAMWMFCLPMQIDGKRGVDLVAGSKGQGAAVGWYESPENPRDLAAWKWHQIAEAGWIMSLQQVDLDGDGTHELLVSDRKGQRRGVWAFRGERNVDGVAWAGTSLGGRDREVMFLAAGSVRGRASRDVVVAVKGRGLTWLREGESANERAWFETEVSMPPNTGSGKGAAIADVNLDGAADLVFTCEHSEKRHGAMWLERLPAADGQPSWRPHAISGDEEGVKFDRIEMLDLDGDGDLDLLTCEERDNLGVIWYENPTR